MYTLRPYSLWLTAKIPLSLTELGDGIGRRKDIFEKELLTPHR